MRLRHIEMLAVCVAYDSLFIEGADMTWWSFLAYLLLCHSYTTCLVRYHLSYVRLFLKLCYLDDGWLVNNMISKQFSGSTEHKTWVNWQACCEIQFFSYDFYQITVETWKLVVSWYCRRWWLNLCLLMQLNQCNWNVSLLLTDCKVSWQNLCKQ